MQQAAYQTRLERILGVGLAEDVAAPPTVTDRCVQRPTS